MHDLVTCSAVGTKTHLSIASSEVVAAACLSGLVAVCAFVCFFGFGSR